MLALGPSLEGITQQMQHTVVKFQTAVRRSPEHSMRKEQNWRWGVSPISHAVPAVDLPEKNHIKVYHKIDTFAVEWQFLLRNFFLSSILEGSFLRHRLERR